MTAPVDGVVQQLAVHTVGGVVTPAQSLLVVVPSASRLEIEAMVSNRDIGFRKLARASILATPERREVARVPGDLRGPGPATLFK